MNQEGSHSIGEEISSFSCFKIPIEMSVVGWSVGEEKEEKQTLTIDEDVCEDGESKIRSCLQGRLDFASVCSGDITISNIVGLAREKVSVRVKNLRVERGCQGLIDEEED